MSLLLAFQSAPAPTVKVDLVIVRSARGRKSTSQGRARFVRAVNTTAVVAVLMHPILAVKPGQRRRKFGKAKLGRANRPAIRVASLLVAQSSSKTKRHVRATLGSAYHIVTPIARLIVAQPTSRFRSRVKAKPISSNRFDVVVVAFKLAAFQVVTAQPSKHRRAAAVSILRVKHANDFVLRVERFIMLGRPPPLMRGPRGRMRGN